MAHYAFLDENNIVIQTIVGKNENEDGIDWEQVYGAVRTSYNTRRGVHYNPETNIPSEDQSKAFRYNYALIGMIYDPNFGPDGAFYWPSPYPSWILDTKTADWVAPIPMPSDELWIWDEQTLSWKK